ncbi:MAG: SUMF1/EgtB/PvdO family nonheme iron enzyme [Phycisphaerales bacterium]|nr:SUMF1/EgtB/PvdO family nonheme iron enzyme [Phycisphaerales bacterium]
MGHRTMGMSVVGVAGVVLALAGAVSVVSGQVSSIVWHAVGDPGNAPWTDDDYPNHQFYGRGTVDYRYRVAETELTTSQWVEFVRAYGPHADNPFDWRFLGSLITGSWQDGEPHYEVIPGYENHAAEMTWRMAARFCNWMHNGQVNEAWAFKDGAYDTSTFTENDNPPPFFNDQDAHRADARYWIPTLDEWWKAVYYDPDKDGAGEGGWWEQPNGTDTVLIADFPENGGETNAGLSAGTGEWDPRITVGMYPDVRTPWGLLDASGGLREWTEEWTQNHSGRFVEGSSRDDWFDYEYLDWVGGWDYRLPENDYEYTGLRVATVVPAPPLGPGTVVAFACVAVSRRRR